MSFQIPANYIFWLKYYLKIFFQHFGNEEVCSLWLRRYLTSESPLWTVSSLLFQPPLPQCAILVFDGLFPLEHQPAILHLLHFSHPFLGTYEVHQFIDLGYLEGTHSRVVNELHTNTTILWNGKPIPYLLIPIPCYIPYYTIPFDLIPYHLGCLGSFYQVWKVFLQAAILVRWAPSFVDRFFRFLLSF